MPARDRRRPRTYKSAKHYHGRIQANHPDQQRLKDQLLEIFAHNDAGHTLLQIIGIELHEGLFVSKEVVKNPDIYKQLRDALESREVRVPPSVIDTASGYFVAKRIIAAIWQDPVHKLKLDLLLFEYHNLRQIVINSNKDILSEEQEQTTILESDPGPSSATRHSIAEIDNSRRTLALLKTEEQMATSGREVEEGSEDE